MEVILQYLKLLSYNYTIDANHQSSFQIVLQWVLLCLQEFWSHMYSQLVYNQEYLLALIWYNTQSRIFLKSLIFIRSFLQDLEWILMHFLHRPYEQDVVEHWTVFSYTNNYLIMILSGSTQNFSAIWSMVSSSFGTGSRYSVLIAYISQNFPSYITLSRNVVINFAGLHIHVSVSTSISLHWFTFNMSLMSSRLLYFAFSSSNQRRLFDDTSFVSDVTSI